MERNFQKNGLVNLIAAVMIFIAAFVVTCYVNSLAGQAASIFLGLGALVAFASWFQMRLEENERLEKLEIDELARAKGESALFDAKESEVFPARRSREQFEKFFVPGFAVLLFLLQAGGAWLLWHWTGKAASGIVPERAMPSLSLFAIFSLLLFLLGRFSVTIARLENHRLLRPGASFLLAGAFVCFFTALGVAGIKIGFPKADFLFARALCVLLGLMALEILLTLLLEIYRPRLKGKIARPLYDSRVVGLLAQPESLFTTAAQALDYQFGFKVSETWFFQLLQKNLPALLLAQLAVLLLSTCVVFVDPGEQAVLEHFGRPVADLNSGAHLKWPWPVDKIYRYRTDQIQTFEVGYIPDVQSESEKTILWSVAHAKEVNFLVGNRATATVQNQNGDTNDTLKAPPVSLISVSIPVQFQITNVMDWAYNNADQSNLLEDLATRDVVHFLAGVDLNDVMSHARLEAAQELQNQIQSDVNAHRLGAKILFVGLQDIHPPVSVAADYENVVGAIQQMIAKTNTAVAAAISTNTLAGAAAFTTTNVAEATRIQLETSAWARAALFTNQIPAFEAAPSVYEQRAYFQAFVDATANARKYVLLVTNTDNVLIFDLEDKIREDLLNLNVPSSPNNQSP
ncbi:MAG TPA: SPFH domain-containing protein [Candidatus Dormibacteraeota bacterium]|nr:SPFH domain-containing protein [Candidatus Dormibacteraeota bacterium]